MSQGNWHTVISYLPLTPQFFIFIPSSSSFLPPFISPNLVSFLPITSLPALSIPYELMPVVKMFVSQHLHQRTSQVVRVSGCVSTSQPACMSSLPSWRCVQQFTLVCHLIFTHCQALSLSQFCSITLGSPIPQNPSSLLIISPHTPSQIKLAHLVTASIY